MEWPRVNVILKLASRLRGKVHRMLDLACSDGSLTLAIKKACGAEDVYGIDIDDNALKMAQQSGTKTFRLDLNCDRLPFEDQSFCLVTICALLEHLDNPDHVMDESYRVLKRGGFLLLHTRNLANWANRLSLLLGFQPYGVRSCSKIENLGLLLRETPLGLPSNHCAFTLRALVEFLEHCGFNIVEIEGAPGVNPRKFPVNFIDKFLSHIPSLSRNVVIVAVK